MRPLVFAFVFGLACSSFGQAVADRVAKQNALFEEYYQAGLKNFPERATLYGDYRYNSQLGQVSLAEIARQHAEADDFLARLRAIPTDGMSDKDLLSHRILEKQLEREDVNYALKNYEMPVNQQNGVHTRLADLPNAVPLDSVPHYQDYISRLHQIPRVLEQTTEVMRQGEKDHLMPPKLVLEKLPGQCDGIIAANPFLEPTKKFLKDFSDADYKKYIHQMEPKLPELFGLLPKSPVTVEPIPDFAKAAATHYVPGTPDGKRPGRVVVAVSNPTKRTVVDDEAVAYHEGVPGHHLQISIAQTLEGLPKFRLHGFLSAYAEGWALYSEVLGKEIGFYQDPVSDYGRLNSEMLRAVRLVVDTGIHDKNWSRQQVIDYMHANDINDALAQTEADRYIAWPGQALAYKMGQLTILKLRDEAKAQLGNKFDIKAFHDEILNGGAMPLDLLQERVEAWIKNQAAQNQQAKT
jgi:uncharacterized protein (DUF885 family)